ncbi:SDR family NAD(P)-dependent oxidoreductase [Patescibacteria group bacterium]|nr:SDR family NAD(P)-dependent oxidoreductase [Patescibacteria group bacterium]
MTHISKQHIVVTGGSGSLGRHLIRELLRRGAKHIISLSRDEGLIKEAKEWIKSSLVQFVIGDVSDPKQLSRILKGADIVFHAAALKDVSNAEKYPREILKVNIGGITNLLDHAENLKRFIHVSSDKAIGVMNCYGASKLLAEYLVSETNDIYQGKFLNIRCPNFLGSRGSVLDIWRRQVIHRNKIEITDPEMTRFFITLPDAAKFIVETGLKPNVSSEITYYPLEYTKKFRLGDLGKAFVKIYGDNKTKIVTTGKRHGEKIHEDYVSNVALLNVRELETIIRSLDY